MDRRRTLADPILFHATLALLVIGIVAVFDASYARTLELRGMGNDGYYFLKRQAGYALVGLLAMLFFARFKYWKLRKLSGRLLLFSFVALVLVFVPHVGIMKNGAHRWLGWGFATIQPSELAKLALLVYLAAVLSRPSFNVRDWKDGLSAPVFVIGLFFILVEREPDLGTAAIIFLSSATLLYLGGARPKHMLGIVGGFGLVALVAILMGHGFRGGRLQTYMNPEADYYGKGFQVSRGLLAVGSGGLKGVGIGAGREKFYLPEANTDFIFATVAEETGLWGAVLVVGLLATVGFSGFWIAKQTNDPFGALLASGIAGMISWQAGINVAVVTGLIPATGVPLPFVSYGGSSLIFLLISIGILLNISAHPDGLKGAGEKAGR